MCTSGGACKGYEGGHKKKINFLIFNLTQTYFLNINCTYLGFCPNFSIIFSINWVSSLRIFLWTLIILDPDTIWFRKRHYFATIRLSKNSLQWTINWFFWRIKILSSRVSLSTEINWWKPLLCPVLKFHMRFFETISLKVLKNLQFWLAHVGK